MIIIYLFHDNQFLSIIIYLFNFCHVPPIITILRSKFWIRTHEANLELFLRRRCNAIRLLSSLTIWVHYIHVEFTASNYPTSFKYSGSLCICARMIVRIYRTNLTSDAPTHDAERHSSAFKWRRPRERRGPGPRAPGPGPRNPAASVAKGPLRICRMNGPRLLRAFLLSRLTS